MATEHEGEIYIVVLNHEEQYSIWPEYKAIPDGWHPAGKSGSKEACLEHIETVWTDMRPLSLRKQMQANETTAGAVAA